MARNLRHGADHPHPMPSESTSMSALAHLRHRLARREDSEHEQALLRIVIVGLVLGTIVYYGFKRFGRPVKEVAG